ncbi:complement C1q-like protein 4 [Dreissena polymorpha]|uniref:complement C1q-like protein 4 n=1 Tax=Dreissena polymorpha TaxID=45954 RepID=UPI0022653DFE|nr:complement C1q-like protein 4 [Dreissena polymorpha]
MLQEIRETMSTVEAALNEMNEMATKTSEAIPLVDQESRSMKDRMDDAVKGGLMQISEAVSAMTTRTSGAIQQMEKETKILKAQLVIPTIYFYARTPESYSVAEGQTVVYTAVEINEGQGYDPATGRFTAFVPGLYAFAVQYCMPYGKGVWLEIVNKKETFQRASFQDNNNNASCLSMQAFIKADVSDQIWVQALGNIELFNVETYRHSSFSGASVHL